jgi:hypothetical protein
MRSEHTGRRPQPSTQAPPHPASAFLTARVGPRPPRGPSRSRPPLACPEPHNRYTIPIAYGDHTRWPAVQLDEAFSPSGHEGVNPHPARPCGRMTEKPFNVRRASTIRTSRPATDPQARSAGQTSLRVPTSRDFPRGYLVDWSSSACASATSPAPRSVMPVEKG